MCSVKNPSCLGSTKAQDVKKFSFDNVEEELQSRAPLLSAVLWAASMRKSKRRPFLEAKCVHAAAATPLKNRSPLVFTQLRNEFPTLSKAEECFEVDYFAKDPSPDIPLNW
ncbi:hypothetical protein OS493_012185 [Desmophyllum pertusum]|uniref:Uncharacterized protein n=1 Tax=Desmophyllum pertusum TaxID=174260 RepID=A0A9X0A6H2_9CNID|nr:hypothetical protein OS493_012185 [Desmophyllum pertusum]